VKILNPGDMDYKVGDTVSRGQAEDANRKLSAKKQQAEFEAHCEYLSAWEEDKYTIAQANVALDEKGRIVPELCNARQAATSCSSRARRSNTSTSAPSNWSRWPRV